MNKADILVSGAEERVTTEVRDLQPLVSKRARSSSVPSVSSPAFAL
jgi:phosphotransacetylase